MKYGKLADSIFVTAIYGEDEKGPGTIITQAVGPYLQ
jgi:hypothetical protein